MRTINSALLILALAGLLAQPASAVDSTFTYQGELTDGGTPVDATVDLNFTLFDAETAGTMLQEVMLTDVVVDDGRFTVSLPFNRAHFDGNERFLEIAVSNPAGSPFEVLDPRQRISPAPYAIFADDGAGGGVWQESGGDVFYNDGNVGIGTDTPAQPLDVIGDAFFGGGPSSFDGAIESLRLHARSAEWTLGALNESSASASDFFISNAGGNNGLFVITGDSKVGIGTPNPAETLTVDGVIESQLGGFKLPDNTIIDDAGDLGGATPWQTSGNDVFYDTGNVGIGTTNPTDLFQVKGPGIVELSAPDSADVPLLQFRSTGNNADWIFRHDNSRLHLQTEVSTGNEIVTFDAGGAVGIGEDTPLGPLHIANDEAALGGSDGVQAPALNNDDIVVEDADAVLGLYSSPDLSRGSVINLGEVGGGILTDVWHLGRETSSAGSGLFFRYGTTGNLDADDELMVLQTNGRVGIGTSAPDGALQAQAPNDSVPDLVLGGNSGSDDNGIVTTDPDHPGSDLFLRSNDAVIVELDTNGDGEDADFEVRDKDENTLLGVDEDGSVSISPSVRTQPLTYEGFKPNREFDQERWDRWINQGIGARTLTSSGDTLQFVAPLHLPDGSDITSLKTRVTDFSTQDEVSVCVRRRPVNAHGAPDSIVCANSGIIDAPGETESTAAASGGSTTVDNESFGYYVFVTVDVPGGSFDENDALLYSVTVEYETTSLLH